jgi:hypothetical protein
VRRALLISLSAVLILLTAPEPSAADDIATEVLDKAVARYQAGELQQAVGGINAAMRARLPAAQLARAYFVRGLAQRKLGQAPQAITDLSRALEHDGLTDAERSEAIENLHAAYAEAGISADERVVVAPGDRTTAAPVKPATTASITSAAAAPPAVVSRTQNMEFAASPAWTSEQVTVSTLPPLPASENAPPPAAKPSAPTAQSPPAVTAAVAKTTPVAPAAPLTAFITEVAVEPQADAQPSASGTSLFVGEARSRNEIVALAVRLTSQRGYEIGPRRPQIAVTPFADMTIYRLRLGPFTDASRAQSLCQSLRDSGYPCVAQ